MIRATRHVMTREDIAERGQHYAVERVEIQEPPVADACQVSQLIVSWASSPSSGGNRRLSPRRARRGASRLAAK